MLDNFPYFLVLIFAIVVIMMAADKIKIAYPILLIVAGLLISIIPGIPLFTIDPELIFLIFLPPLLYEAAWAISWKELWHWRRIILSFAFVVVFLTALSVAFVANYFIPGFTLALGFLLGGIVSPPDAVSAGAILKFVKVPRTISSILEGESLLNDASSLIIFRFALIAVGTGQFVWSKATMNFSWMVIGGIGIGLLIGWLFMKFHKYLPTDANMDIALTLITPYMIYLAAEEVHSSGVLAVVSAGLYLSHKRHSFLSSASRVRGYNVWQSLVFVLNGLVFTMIGLSLPMITAGLGNVSLTSAIGYGVLVTAVLIVGRILAAYGAVITTLIARNFITVADRRNPGVKGPFIIGWTGMRGVVSLAAALSIPVHMSDGSPFPQRNLILFITFMVILLTMVVQGLTLPYIIRKFHMITIEEEKEEERQFKQVKYELADFALKHLNDHYGKALEEQPILQKIAHKWEDSKMLTEDTDMTADCKIIYLNILSQQRKWLLKKNKKNDKIDENIIRRHLHHLDMEEEKVRYL
ncbi:Na+/H+ antiporter [Flavobacterium wongokense]|uniref:Na+/H+ antiporter n=1 Tax=Flavobacterium wongokense TaxID=2910674 RepID=UPI001F3B12C5|nr:Na+/H+ antiporter [Flavobacterium sp. WG47]MCF6131943.1 Na+/H+ antiporter [Flavobacterium sp. WG47]